jgi:hypothetical protein
MRQIFVVQKPSFSVFEILEVFLNVKKRVWANRAALTTGPFLLQKLKKVYFYRFSHRFLMTSTFLAFLANFPLVESLG